MNRNDLRDLVRIRLREARVLLKSGCYEGAYYLAGYAVECGLKACIAKKTRRYDFPILAVVRDSYEHKLPILVKTAGLQGSLDLMIQNDLAFKASWTIVSDWRVETRYSRPTQVEAVDLYAAITDKQHGVLQWVRQHW